MKIDVTEDGTIRLKDVFNSVVFETDEGEKIAVCMRDGGFEIGIKDTSAKGDEEYYSWYRAMDGSIDLLDFKVEDLNPDLCDDVTELSRMLNEVSEDDN